MITDWNDAYANREHIPGAETFINRWPTEASTFRTALSNAGRASLDQPYGPGPRRTFDLFAPDGPSAGLVVYVHGGYWRAFDKSLWSAFAAGAVTAGWTVAVPSYPLVPEVRIAEITCAVAAAISAAAALVEGPIRLSGHSAGGHLVSRAACTDTILPAVVTDRIAHVLTISGVHDLRPLLKTDMNADFQLDAAEATAESPALQTPRPGARVTAWVGGAERPEFVRQTRLLANIWTGLGADVAEVVENGRHHFDVIDGLMTHDSALSRALLS